jgi:hypothetical protein
MPAGNTLVMALLAFALLTAHFLEILRRLWLRAPLTSLALREVSKVTPTALLTL